MKLCLIFLVLVPFAFAYHALPTSRILIDGDYLMAENLHARKLFFSYFNDRLRIQTLQNAPKLLGETIDIKGDFSNQKRLNRSLAIDSYAYTRDYAFSCLQAAKENVRDLIAACSGNIHLREMTAEEQKAMEQYKKNQTTTNKPFELAYHKKFMGVRSFGLKELAYEAYPKLDGFSINLVTLDKNFTERSMWVQSESLTNATFFIEGLPTGSKVDCYGEYRDDELEPVKCKGEIVFK